MENGWPDNKRWDRRNSLDRRHRRLGLAAVVVAVAVGVFLIASGDDEESTEKQIETPAEMVEADAAIAGALSVSRDQLHSGEAEAIVQARREEQARNATWEEGESVLLAGELQADQSAYLALLGRDVPDPEIFRVLTATEEEFDFQRSRPGDRWRARVDEDGRVVEFRYETSPEDVWLTTLGDDGEYTVEKKEIDVDVRTRSVAGEVEASFWLSMSRHGHSDVLAHRFMRVFEYTLDFNTETRDGDQFAMVFEEVYLDDELLRYGRILGATYLGEFGHHRAYYFESDEESGYFDEAGESLQKMFLRSPLSVTRVTSGFGRRQHPITGDERMHRGVDYGAPTGTPVQAVADGRVHFAGWRGGYGNLLILRHSAGYETRYAHLSGFASGISAGARVAQGQVVAHSGNTGASTAPHLHYEMLRHGRHINPLTVEATSGDPLTGSDLETFQAQRVEPITGRLVEALTDAVPEATVAWEHEAPAASAQE